MPTSFPSTIDAFTNPGSGDQLNTPAVLHHTQHSNHNDSVTAIETKLGVDFSTVASSIDYIVTSLLTTQTEHGKAGYKEILPAGDPFPTTVTWYTDSGKTITLVSKAYTYDSRLRITSVVYKIYDGTVSNVLKRTITDTITFQGQTPFEINRTRVVS